MTDDCAAPGADPPPGTPLFCETGDAGGPDDQSSSLADSRGCLFALSQPPLMVFLGVVGTLLLLTAVHDLCWW